MSVKLNKNYLKWSIIAIILLAAVSFIVLRGARTETGSNEASRVASESKDKQKESISVSKVPDAGVTFKSITDYDDNHPVPDFINNSEGYAIFGRADIYHTTDGGEHWNKIIYPSNQLWNIN